MKAYWENMNPKMKKYTAMSLGLVVIFGIVAIFSSGEKVERKTTREESIRHILTDSNTREVGIDALSADLKLVARENEKLKKDLERFREEMTRDTGQSKDKVSGRDLARIEAEMKRLKEQNVLIIGSGFSFHNLSAIFVGTGEKHDSKNDAFHDWLTPTCVGNAQSDEEKTQNLINWQNAPHARYCHPREEQLLPLHVCFAAATAPGRCVFDDKILGKRSTAYLW